MSIEISRRSFLKYICFASLSKKFFLNSQEKILRPPGSIEEISFLASCIRCQECVKICPTNALQPVLLEANLLSIWTPKLFPKSGGCELCLACPQVCPTGAIKEFNPKKVKMGTANLNKDLCLSWRKEKRKICLICVEQCSNLALKADRKKRPVFHEDKCIGCGICENICPAKPVAITVSPKGEKRIKI